MWCLDSSEAVRDIIRDSYKQARHEDDLNQPLSVQPWGQDGDKRRFWLIEGQDDTYFRLYRESNPLLKLNTWRSVAGSIDEVKTVAGQLTDENSQAGRRLSDRILAAIPRFEASDDVGDAGSLPRLLSSDASAEAKAAGLSYRPTSSIYTTRARLFSLRRSDSRQADKVYLFR